MGAIYVILNFLVANILKSKKKNPGKLILIILFIV